MKKFPFVTYIRSEDPLGKGGAVYAGFDRARGSIIGFSDADGAVSASEFTKLISALDYCDMAIASRWLPRSYITKKQSFFRRLTSRMFNLFVKVSLKLPFSDTQCGAKVLKKSTYDTVKKKLTAKHFSFDVDLLSHVVKHGFVVSEEPITWRHVEGGTTFKPLPSGIKAVKDIIVLRFLVLRDR